MELRKASLVDFKNVFALMQTAFPKDEYRPYEEQKALLHDPRYQIHILSPHDEDTIVGFLSMWDLEEFVFFEHFAVSPKYRNQGIGANMLRSVIEQISKPMCLEVELPNTPLAARRIAFYERNGFCLNTYPYRQPAFAKDREEVPLFLMTTQPLSKSEFEKMQAVILRNVYKVSDI